MAENSTVEQRIATYLAENNITINIECRRNGFDVLIFQQYLPDGRFLYLGEIAYDRKTGSSHPADDSKRGLQPEGFVHKVRIPMVELLKQVQGDFYDGILDPIHDAIDRIDAKYKAKYQE